MPEVDVRRVMASDGRRARSIRLEALDDPAAHIAFLETTAAAKERPESFWQDRAVSAALSDQVAQFIAEERRDWVGTVTVLIPDTGSLDSLGRVHPEGRAQLVAVYVRDSHRGRGILAAMVDAASDWVRASGCRELALDVHEQNGRAQRAYARLGFIDTGVRSPVDNGVEYEMVRAL